MAISRPEPTSTTATRELWNAGDYSVVSSRVMIAAEALCETADVRGGRRALDVACGDGNTALAMARRDLRVTAVDIVPALVERAQERARFEGLDIEFAVGNAEALDFKDNSFDVVLSSFGVSFAADQQAVASELLRVCRPGGRIALANWSPLDFWSELPGVQAKFAPPPPGAPSPMKWGSEEGLRELFRVSAIDRDPSPHIPLPIRDGRALPQCVVAFVLAVRAVGRADWPRSIQRVRAGVRSTGCQVERGRRRNTRATDDLRRRPHRHSILTAAVASTRRSLSETWRAGAMFDTDT